MKLIGWFSGGIASAVACHLAIKDYGKENVMLYFFETGRHHPDMQRFIQEFEEWTGTHVIQVQAAKWPDPYQVMTKTGYVNGPAGARCTLEQKKNVRFEIEKEVEHDGQIFGFDWSKREVNRAIRFREQYPDTNPIFPLIENKVTKSECMGIIKNAGIDVPTMYRLGYHNNNCVGCVKGGKGYWNKIRQDFPETFEEMKKVEEKTGHSAIKGKFLKDLSPEEGRHEKPITAECGAICQEEFGEVDSPKLEKVMGEQLSIYDI